ncbi:hypothetical protein JM93_01587 [Roseibium hamelinense]|uniref:Uncharacterized protein n=1 Tax=Roseibium hamelinense TaxID=150831 RepID=A0A562T8B4_9HYPH|nr:hypothetical protein [Roseibium hamelinense]MTI43703.1 hypothetical protein [Roseibium hamelinense]TWI89384.1 hypothetical protein JM93_01587 [Roseibium hamelinense]
MPFVQIDNQSHSWAEFKADWAAQCDRFAEDIDDYATATLPVLEKLVINPEPKAGVFSLKSDSQFLNVCQVNTAAIPGYDGPVLRVRNLTVAPLHDFGDISDNDYGQVLIKTLVGVMEISDEGDLKADHVKFHLRSPIERSFFQALGVGLDNADVYKDVRMAGAWLYITK